MSLLVGIDGCKSGWFSVWQRKDGIIQSSIFLHLHALREFFKQEKHLIIGIDMPVILSDVSPRRADQLARKLLSKRASCVFTAPTPRVLMQLSYEKASAVSKRLFGKSMSKQSWYLFPKIRDVQTVIHDEWIDIYEVHPELSFRAMNHEKVIQESKKSNEGFLVRSLLIQRYFKSFNFESIRKQYTKKEVSNDDILDAIAVLWSTKRIASNEACFLPNDPEKPNMQIIY